MKDDSTFAKKFTALMKKICKTYKSDDEMGLEPTAQIIVSFMEWNATNAMALEAFDALMQDMVDHNDIRVSLPQEVVSVIGEDYPLAFERCCRMNETLHELYNREHGVTINSLKGKNKKQIKTYFETMPGITPYIVSQMLLVCYGAHAIPLDEHMLALLKVEEVVHEDCTLVQAQSFCDRHIKATDALKTHHAMRAWADEYELMIPEASPITAPALEVKLSDFVVSEEEQEQLAKSTASKPKSKISSTKTKVPAKAATTKTTKKKVTKKK